MLTSPSSTLLGCGLLALNPLLETAVHLDGLDVGDGVSGGRASRPVRVAVAPDVPETVGGLSGNLYSSQHGYFVSETRWLTFSVCWAFWTPSM